MRSLLLASAALGLAVAAPAPVPQDIDFDLAYALPNPTFTEVVGVTAQTVTYNPTTVFSAALQEITATQTDDAGVSATTDDAVEKRAASTCAAQPSGYGPVPSPDTASAFLSYGAFASSASAAPIPSGYVQEFQNAQASNNAYGYMGYTTLTSYDADACAAKCNAINGCISVNIYFERDPTVNPNDASCSNPSSTTIIKCVFWGGPVSSSNAVNSGQYRSNFQVVIAGSNGYTNSSVASPAGYGTPVPLGNAAINAPYDSYGFNSFMGDAIFVGAFNAQLCADACTTKSNYALQHPPTDGSPVQTCQFFNTYILYINTTSNLQGQYCAMYSESWSSSFATNVGQYRGSDHFMIEYSFAYSNTTNPGSANPTAAVYQARADILYPGNSALPYCSSILSYTIPVTTITSTTTTTLPAATSTTITTLSTVTSFVQATATVTATSVAYVKRDDSDASSTLTPVISTSAGTLVKVLATAAVEKRDVSSIPNVLTKYPASIVTSACSLAATSPASTSTVTVVAAATASPATIIITATMSPTPVITTITTTVSQYITITSTTSTPTASPIPSSVPCGATIESNGFHATVQCNRAWVSGGGVATKATLNYNDCVNSFINNDAAFGAQWSATTSLCTQYYYPGDPSAGNNHYTTQAAAGEVFLYISDFLVGG